LLIEDPHLTEPQSEIIQALINSTQRLAKLNKTLLLLSKIENQQFMEKEEVRLKPLFEEVLTYFEEQKENLHLSVTMEIQQDAAVIANPVLVDLLFTNLVKNAFSHNILHGSVHLIVDHKMCTISNTSPVTPSRKESYSNDFINNRCIKTVGVSVWRWLKRYARSTNGLFLIQSMMPFIPSRFNSRLEI